MVGSILGMDLSTAQVDLRAAPMSISKASPVAIGAAFGRVSILSFGGGSATQLLMRNELVWRQQWLSEEEFVRLWQLSKLSLGSNIIGQAILDGQRLAGWAGAVAAVAGLMLPSAV